MAARWLWPLLLGIAGLGGVLQVHGQVDNLGTRSCYTLQSLVAGLKYLIRAKFWYGNYDGLDRAPVFDLHVGVNYWTTVNISNANTPVIYEIIAVVPGESVQVCLVNTGSGTPFISALDLRPLKNGLYPMANATQGLVLHTRANFGRDDGVILSFPNNGHHQYNVSLNATANSTLPPILNALEIFSVLPTTGITTATQDGKQAVMFFRFQM
ncbi:unnamed protein product [Triticum turgidum subsp. durum]|uniref:Malectin-like domain-containing protein n=1 Tax=Triticum turgidum subsp. durum TaxID=4567 RepID=A0A9R0QH70_TRITD|nr:unnamed protein product [Triticum turgidum subsp. durum]